MLRESVGLHALAAAMCCVLMLLLVACQVYERPVARSRHDGVRASRDAASAWCAADAACSEDGCRESCNGEDDDCDGLVDELAADSCELAHAQAVCSEGACQIAHCTDGYRDCDQEPDNGCEVARDSIDHCGQCQRACRAEHGTMRCVSGRCELERCDPGFADCDGNGRSCEVELAHDARHCGACQWSCGFFVESPHAVGVCVDGGCRTECAQGYGDCDDDPTNGCERSLRTDSDCGACGVECALANADAQCVEGTCELVGCAPGYADCDADRQDCERSLSDRESCGGCEQRCELAHAQTRCHVEEGTYRCELEGCDDGFENCDGVADNGCERDTRSLEAGGMGPCLPEPDCKQELLADRRLFLCNTPRSWQAAREVCQRQRGGDLAELSAQTRILLLSQLEQRVWIGHNSLAALDLWSWASTNVPFWQGRANGRGLDNAFTRWARNEPNGSGRCGALTANAEMDDLTCTMLQPFICELAPDECPEDPEKLHPGQCGCGVRDTDSNQDGFAECPD